MLNNFDKALSLVLQNEGGFSINPFDDGNKLPDGRQGCTNKGITQANWEIFVGHKVSHNDMKALTQEQIAKFYKTKYWNLSKCDELPSGVDYVVFDFAVNAGVGRAIKTLQQAIGVTADGFIGSVTMYELARCNATIFIDKYSEKKIEFYQELVARKPDQQIFLKGWLNRVSVTRQDAKNLVSH
jgi:lysozyme family protein